MPTVVDTVIAHYFALVDRFELLLALLDKPVVMPRVVFDPEDDDAQSDDAVSEITQGVRYHERKADSSDLTEDERSHARTAAKRLAQIRDHVNRGSVTVTDMSAEELQMFAQLTARDRAHEVSLLLPLGAGEAACLAIALKRGYVLATDDQDALRILRRLAPGHPYERIRKLLIRAANDNLVTKQQANAVHTAIRERGFWDRTAPFSDL